MSRYGHIPDADSEIDTCSDILAIQTPDTSFTRHCSNGILRRPAHGSNGHFREALQEVAATVMFDHEEARSQLLEVLSHICRNGKCTSSWGDAGTTYGGEFCSDGPVWVPLAINEYIRETGDFDILQEQCPWFDGGNDTVREHLVRTVHCLFDACGEHGLPLIQDSDWCNIAGLPPGKGNGEDIWLAIALYRAMMEIAGLLHFLNDPVTEQRIKGSAYIIRHNVNEFGWDGEWFLQAYTTDGNKIGSGKSGNGYLFLNPQSWAILSGITTPEREELCFRAIDRMLDSENGLRLMHACSTPAEPAQDQSRTGVVDIEAHFYTATAHKIIADCSRGRGTRACGTLSRLDPGSGDTAFQCLHAAIEYMLGPRRTFDGLKIDPCIPSHWDGYSVTRTYRGSIYRITVTNPDHVETGVKELVVDGERVESPLLPVTKEKEHDVRVVMGCGAFQ